MKQTWTDIVRVEKPIPLSELQTTIIEGKGLEFPIQRSFLANRVNDLWSEGVSEMARVKQQQLAQAIANNDQGTYEKIMSHIAGISSQYRLNQASLEGSELLLEVGITDFKQYLGTTKAALTNPEFRQQLIDAGIADANDASHYFANSAATAATIITSDGKTPIGMRSKHVAIYPEVPHIIGGYVKVNGDNKPDFTVRDVDFFRNMRQELQEEMGIENNQIVSSDFIGIVRNITTQGPELLYAILVKPSAQELEESWRENAPDKFEHRAITFYDRGELERALETYGGKMVPSGEAALRLQLQHYK